MMCEIIEGLWNMFRKWKGAFESKDLKVILGKVIVMVSGSVTKNGLSKGKK